jgi:hypothetical protein
MSSISSQQEATNSHRCGKSLVDFVRTYVHDLVLIRVWGAGEKLLEFLRLSSQQFLPCQSWDVAVCDTPKTILAYDRRHEEVFWVHYEVGVLPAKFAKVVVRLVQQGQ